MLTFDMGPAAQIMRTKDSDEQIRYLKQASDADTLDQIFTGLDVLGSVPWKINRQVFEVVSTVWNTGEELADIPAKTSLTAPLEAEKPDNMDTDPRAKDTYRHRIRKALQDRRAAHSTRCDANYKLEIGRAVSLVQTGFHLNGSLTWNTHAHSSLMKRSTSLTTSISEVAPIPSRPTCHTLETTCAEDYSCLPKRSRWGNVD